MKGFVFLKIAICFILCPQYLSAQNKKFESVVKVWGEHNYSAEQGKDGVLLVQPNSQLYDAYNSNSDCVYEINDSYEDMSLSLSLYMVNNTPRPITVSELVVDVERSELDKCPYVRPYVSETHPCKLLFYNEGNGRWRKADLELSLWWNYKSVEVKKPLPYFDKKCQLDLFDDIISLLGVDEKRKYKDFLDVYYTDYYEVMESFAKILHEDDIVELLSSDRCADVCLCSGRLVFDDGMYVLNFRSAEIPLFLSSPKLGSALSGSFGGKFEVFLQCDHKDYLVRIPYHTEISPGKSEWVTFEIKCDKSSIHEMSVLIRDGNKVLSDNKVKLHYFNSAK